MNPLAVIIFTFVCMFALANWSVMTSLIVGMLIVSQASSWLMLMPAAMPSMPSLAMAVSTHPGQIALT